MTIMSSMKMIGVESEEENQDYCLIIYKKKYEKKIA